MSTTYENALVTPGAYRVDNCDGFTIGRFITTGQGIRWSVVMSPWSNEASSIKTLLRNVPAATITRLDEEA